MALGSSSTYGAGASTSAASYPSRLVDELSRRFPGHDITVLNRGVNGDEAADMLARLDTAVDRREARPGVVAGRHELRAAGQAAAAARPAAA